MDTARLREIHQQLLEKLPSETEPHSITHVLIGVIECVMPFAQDMPVDADDFVRQITEKEKEARLKRKSESPPAET